MSAKEKNSLERYNERIGPNKKSKYDKTEWDNIDKMVKELSVEELSQVFKDRPDLVCLAIEYLYFA